MKRVIDWLDDKKIAVMALVGLIISLIPFFYLSHYARPAGDDLNYGIFTHAAWVDTGSLWEVIKAALYTVKVSYSWGGEWLAYFFNSLMPEVFAPYVFWIGPYFFILLHAIGTAVFLYYFMNKVLGIAWEYVIIIYSILFFIMLQYLPSYNIGMYWFSGAFHYIVPHIIFLISFIFVHQLMTTKTKRYIVFLSLCGLMIGGISIHYTMMMLMVYSVLIVLLIRKEKRILWLILPNLLCFAGFIVYTKSPGHNVRASSGLSLNLENLFLTVGRSIMQEIKAPFEYITDVPLIVILFLIIIVFGFLGMMKAIKSKKCSFTFRYPLIYFVLVFLINSAINAPRIYTIDFLGVTDTSMGPWVVEWMVFFFTWSSAILYLEGYVIIKLLEKQDKTKYSGPKSIIIEEGRFRRWIIFPTIVLCLLLAFHWRGTLRDSFAYQAYVYVRNGEAADYKLQIAEYMEVLLDDSIEEVYLKPINNVQGPLLHWAVMEDEDNFVNWAYKEFYRKKKVVIGEPRVQ